MSWEDIIYLFLLFFCIGFGYVYRQIEDLEKRKLVGTVVGLFVIFIVSGFHILHPVVTTLVNALIILYIDKR